ncbi:NrfD/PsrC family molybdoenzyme membrane anchor subunit [Saccharomonospora cyanea]|uniref:Formate-dependent nitrite reductase, membrane component n=1 Tax=Saccharomonospora cyanea NA-134 TaxID=882082 RepID=H5XML5_9PSEU|nr:NrfD/PsrC family molybdoenzyme membrane anchor subunit [Saccharomonospora cyanea]EHR60994.1 formate-dependent nitrite reductase, membrane component [Saccharomonospora cyanea NA-134]
MTRREDRLREPRSDRDAADTHARMFARRGERRGDDGSREPATVPRAEFRSYYGRPVLKPPVWEWLIPAYFFTGGLSAGTAVLAAGADLTSRPALRRVGRVSALASLGASTYLLIADLGRPERFHHMLRVARPTSPMSVGTWILAAYGPAAGLAAVSELVPKPLRRSLPARLLRRLARPAGLSAAAVAPAVASYTAVLLSQTAVPAWHSAHSHLPFVFTGSAAASAGGLGQVLVPVEQAGPARAFAVSGAAMELVASKLMERGLGLVGKAYSEGRAGRLRSWSHRLTVAGTVGSLLAARRSRAAAALSGLALLGGSVLQRFAVFRAGVASTEDPQYVVVPQRERLAERAAAGGEYER